MSKITKYFNLRVIFYLFLTILIFAIPFIRINGNHLFLLNFDKQKLNLFFVSFNTNELYLMPFLLIMMFVFIFFITNLLGRVWCAWGCPQTIFRVIYRDLIQTKIFNLYGNRKNKQNEERNKIIPKFLSIIIFYFVSIVAASNFMWYFIPPEDFFLYIQNPNEHKILIGIVFCLSLFITYDITFIKEKFCAYLCPYARVQSVMVDDDTKIVIYDEGRGGIIYKDGEKITKKPIGGECIACEACVKICPTHIDIRKGMQLDCINCLECADACSKIQSKFNRPSLISWSSTKEIKNKEKFKYLRPKTIIYTTCIFIMFLFFMYQAEHKETMLLNINRTSELYTLHDGDKIVHNAYTMLFHNTDNKDHKFYIDVLDDDIKIDRPNKEFLIKAGQKVKKVVVLESEFKKVKKHHKHINIRAYALDDNKIFTIKDTIFIYPKEKKWKEKKN
nr:cytochrome c oxidase accessory protein CcoG [Campylobacter sp. MG1]